MKKRIASIVMMAVLVVGIALTAVGISGRNIYNNAADMMGVSKKDAMSYIQAPETLTELGDLSKIGADKVRSFLKSLGLDGAKVDAAVDARAAYEAAVAQSKNRDAFFAYAQSVDETVTEDNFNELVMDHDRSDPMRQEMAMAEMGADEEKAYCSASIELSPEDDWHSGYPFACRLNVTYTLTEKGVHMDASVENLGEADMPFGFALHPYFTKRGDGNTSFIRVPAQRYYETDGELIPTGTLLPAEGKMVIHDDFHSVESLDLDTVYRGLTQDHLSQVKWADMQLTIAASDCFRNAVVFTPKNRPGFCIEPQTCATNFLNLHAQGLVDESGLLLLPAGRTFDCWVDFSAEKQ